MKLLTIALTFLLLLCSPTSGQDNSSPFTKEEILRLVKVKPVPGKRDAQGDLAGAIEARGIAFPADEKTLEEFRQAGARAFVIDAGLSHKNKLPPTLVGGCGNGGAGFSRISVENKIPPGLSRICAKAKRMIDKFSCSAKAANQI